MPSDRKVATLAPDKAAQVLEERLGSFRGELTVADAAAKGGLALREAEVGLHGLVARYHGHLAATDRGELVFRFPEGLVKPPEQRALRLFARRVGKALVGVGRFAVRAWVSVVLLGYAAVFAVILIALAFRGGDRDDDGFNVGDGLAILGRVLFEALYWTFHPFSPVWINAEPGWIGGRVRRQPKLPLYERVNRFVFGPTPPPVDPREERRKLVAEIRRLDGRIGLADVMRVTGRSRGDADALLSKLLLDYDGDVEVSDDGAIFYRFSELLRTTDAVGPAASGRAAPAAWAAPKTLAPLTGNEPGSNVLFGAINAFNLLASGWAIGRGLTLERLQWEFERATTRNPFELGLPPDGTALVLGWIPFLFSAALFLLPLGRMLGRGRKRRAVERENGRLAVLKAVIEHRGGPDIPEADLRNAFRQGAKRAPKQDELLAIVRELDGDLELLDDGRTVFRFSGLGREREALARERAAARPSEREVGQVVFASDAETDPSAR